MKAIHFPHGDHVMPPTPSGIVAMVRISPLLPMGMMQSVVSPFFSLRPLVNASQVPSGDQLGLPSRFSPAVSGRGAVAPSAAATHTCERYLFAFWSTRVTTYATCLPSGETAGDDAPICREIIFSANSACRDAGVAVLIAPTLVGWLPLVASGLLPQFRIPWLHDGVDDLEAFFEVGEGALHRVDRDPLKVIQRPAEGIGTLGELAGH